MAVCPGSTRRPPQRGTSCFEQLLLLLLELLDELALSSELSLSFLRFRARVAS